MDGVDVFFVYLLLWIFVDDDFGVYELGDELFDVEGVVFGGVDDEVG